jgi:hypothetical protein
LIWINTICEESNNQIKDIREKYDAALDPLLLQIASLKQEVKKIEDERERIIHRIVDDYHKLADENAKKREQFNHTINADSNKDLLIFLHEFCEYHSILSRNKEDSPNDRH